MNTAAQLDNARRDVLPQFMRGRLSLINGSQLGNHCETCRLNVFCLPKGLPDDVRRDLTALVVPHKRVQAGESLYRAGEPLTHLYLVKTGTFKTVVLLDDGREQITGFRMPGDTLAIDAIGFSHHPSEAVALEDAHVCAIPFNALHKLSDRSLVVQHHLRHLLASEVVREQSQMLLLGRMQAEERVVAFLLDLSRRFGVLGYSPNEFTLPMGREEIGNYLGLTLETVSRCFSRLKQSGLLIIRNRSTRIVDLARLGQVIGAREREN